MAQTLETILKPVYKELSALEKDLIKTIPSTNPLVEKICKHIISAGGKRLRPALVFLVKNALNKDQSVDLHMELAQAVEFIHTATLIHDDVIDNADKRRNVATINKIWDEKTAVMAGDFLLSQALINFSKIKNFEVLDVFSKAMKQICEGEIEQNLQTNKIVSLEDYIEKSKRKTALLFVAAAKNSAILSNASEDQIETIETFALNFGIAFQIIDDLLNFQNTKDKPTLNDLKSGIITAPIIYASYEKPEIIQLLKTKNKNDKLNDILVLVSESQGAKKTKELAYIYIRKAINALEPLNNSIYKDSLISLTKFYFENKVEKNKLFN